MEFTVQLTMGKRVCRGASTFEVLPSGVLVVTDTEKGEVVTYSPTGWVAVKQRLE